MVASWKQRNVIIVVNKDTLLPSVGQDLNGTPQSTQQSDNFEVPTSFIRTVRPSRVDRIHTVEECSCAPIEVQMMVNGQMLDMEIDTGADKTRREFLRVQARYGNQKAKLALIGNWMKYIRLPLFESNHRLATRFRERLSKIEPRPRRFFKPSIDWRNKELSRWCLKKMASMWQVTVNQVLSVEQYPLPKPEDLFATLAEGNNSSYSECTSPQL